MFIKPVFASGDIGPAPAGLPELNKIITNGISFIVGFAFIALTVMFFWAGVKFITSNGDAKSLAAARQTAIQALLGLFFLALAWVVLVTIEGLTGVKVTGFCLGFQGVCW